MSEVLDRYAAISDGFTARLAGVSPDRWSDPSPCAEWSARDVVVHVVNTHRRVRASIDGSTPAEVSGDDDLEAAWELARSSIVDALGDKVLAGQTVRGMFGEQPFESLVSRLLCADTLVHTWDLARATGQDETLDPDAVGRAMEFLTPLDEVIRRPGGFAAKLDPVEGTDEQTRFLNFCGRAA